MWDKKTVITRTIEYHYASLTGRCESSGTRNAIAYLIVYTQRHPEKQNKKDRKIRESLKIKKKRNLSVVNLLINDGNLVQTNTCTL